MPSHRTFTSLIEELSLRRKHQPKSKAKRKVHFISDPPEVWIYEYPEETPESDLYYSELDYIQMRNARHRIINQARQRFLTLSFSGRFDEAELLRRCSWAGIENTLTLELMKKSMRCKERSMGAVFDEQAKQVKLGVYNPDKLAYASQLRSMWAIKRAKAIGHHQSNHI